MSRVDRVLQELPAPGLLADAELDAVRMAITVEGALDVVLPDAEISPEHLGTADAVRDLVRRHLGGC